MRNLKLQKFILEVFWLISRKFARMKFSHYTVTTPLFTFSDEENPEHKKAMCFLKSLVHQHSLVIGPCANIDVHTMCIHAFYLASMAIKHFIGSLLLPTEQDSSFMLYLSVIIPFHTLSYSTCNS